MRTFLTVLSVSLLSLAVCAQTPAAKAPTKAPAKKAAAPAKAAPAPPKTPRPDGLYTTISTSMGDITLKLFDKESPITVKNFVGLARGSKPWTDPKTHARVSRPLYNGLTFHRVIENFMIQGGDPTGTGMGGTDVIKDEIDPTLKFDQPGRLAMANAGPHTGSCQFFITEVPTPHLNGLHAIFGQVVEHQELVSQITHVAKNGEGRPNTPVVIKKVTFERWQDGKEAPLFPPAAPAAKTGTATKAPAKAPAAAPAKK
jgi:peptidyl-prolyl cis-trans isomerase A (cyclophilin A)